MGFCIRPTPHRRQSCKSSSILDHKCMRVLSVASTIGAIFIATVAPCQDVSRLIRKADELDAQGRTNDAIEVLQQAEKITPNDPTLLINLSQDYSDQIDDVKERSKKMA